MPDLLLEFFSEEIPARMQARAADDLRKLVTDKLVAAGLPYEGAKAFATPRRLALAVQGVPVRAPDVKEEKKGPRVGAPDNAIKGFLRAAGLASIEQAKVQPDKKGDFYVAVIDRPGRPAIELIAEIVPDVARGFPWPKSMRWGEGSARPGSLGWVRPLHSIVATFGPETEEPEIVSCAVDGIAAGDVTRGHRFLAPAPFKVRRLDDYMAKLEQAKVVLDPERRKEIILADATNLAFAQGYELVRDDGLLAEVAGLVEWPVVLMGAFDEAFLTIPGEVIRATIRNNQKCFVLRGRGSSASSFETPSAPQAGQKAPQDEAASRRATPERSERASSFETRPAAAPQDEATSRRGSTKHSPHPEEPERSEGVSKDEGVAKNVARLAPRFILVSNIEADDGGKAIVAGNERVIRARLSDAKFFYDTDLKTRLEDRLEKFKQIVFHEKLGSQWERIERIERLAAELAPLVGADVEKAKRAAKLCKADLLTEVVGEFPEVQGLMGKYYALAQGEDATVANACEDHYKPKGPDDLVPADPVSIAVALADKLDTLVGFWAIDEKPTGSKDPYALRRAALGIIRLTLENQIRFPLLKLARNHAETITFAQFLSGRAYQSADVVIDRSRSSVNYVSVSSLRKSFTQVDWHAVMLEKGYMLSDAETVYLEDDKHKFHSKSVTWAYPIAEYIPAVLSFFADRLKVQLREQGARHDLVDAVFALEGQDDLVLIVRRVEALGKFLDTEDGKNLLAGYKRATNILRIEEKKDARGIPYAGRPDPSLYRQDEEWALAKAIDAAREEASAAVAREDFAGAMTAMARLRPHVDAFFDKVTVNVSEGAEAAKLRENRLRLLNEIREATRAVADFSRIEG